MVTSGLDHAPSVSVIVPLYNKAAHVDRALDAVFAQTMHDVEVVVVDDGSTDDGAAIVARRGDPRIRLVRQENAGVSAARNAGVALARAPVVAFLDADDAWHVDFLANMLSLRATYPDAGGWAFNYEVVSPDGERRSPGVARPDAATCLLDPATYVRLGRFGSPVFTSSVAVDRATFTRVGGFPVGVPLGEDIDTWLRICIDAPIAFDARLGGIYFLDAADRAVCRHAPPERYVFFDTLDRWAALQPRLPARVADDIREFKNFFALVYARHQIRWGRRADGRRALRALRTRAFTLPKWKWLIASFVPQGLQGRLVALKADR